MFNLTSSIRQTETFPRNCHFLQATDVDTSPTSFHREDEDDDLYSDDLRPGAPKGQKAASSAIV